MLNKLHMKRCSICIQVVDIMGRTKKIRWVHNAEL